jgi:hypothetical protein
MWFTGRFSGAATVLVLAPSQVTGLPEGTRAFDEDAPSAGRAVLVVGLACGEEEPEPEEGAAEEGAVDGEFGVAVAPVAVAGFGVSDAWTPVPSSHAVRESAARTTVAAAAARRAREVRRLDMRLAPSVFGLRW